MSRLIIHPGWVYSKNDGDKHFITFTMLCSLYSIHPQKAIDGRREGHKDQVGDYHFYPRHDGSYWKHEEV